MNNTIADICLAVTGKILYYVFPYFQMRDTDSLHSGSISNDKKLKKVLTSWDLYFLSLGAIIGSGWLFAESAAAGTAGPAAILSWIIGGAIVLVLVLVYAEIGAMIPRSGFITRYGHYSHGGIAGLFFGWGYFAARVAAPALEAEAAITYAGSYITKPALIYYAKNPLDPSSSVTLLSGYGILIAAALIAGFYFLNYFGVKLMGKTNQGITWWKLIIPSITIILMVFLLFHAGNFNNPALGGFLPHNNISLVFEAISTDGIVFSYLGFRHTLNFAGEAKNPQRDIPRALIYAMLTSIVVYVLLQFAFISAINPSLLTASGGWLGLSSASAGTYAKSIDSAPFAFLAKSSSLAILAVLTYLLYADAYISPAGTLNIAAGTATRSLYGLAEIGYFPRTFGKVSKRTGVPVFSLLISLVLGLIFLVPLPSWYVVVGLVSGVAGFTYILGGSTLMVLRREASDLKRPFKLPYARILSPVAFIGASLIVYWTGWPTVAYIAIILFAGFAVYLVFLAFHHVDNIFTKENIQGGYWVPLLIIALTILSYLGESNFGGINLFPFPYDFLVVMVVSLIFYFLSVKSGFRTSEITDMIESGEQYIDEYAE
ncbi:aspartate/glutamate family transporter [Ferroplasma acidiphilum]|uniref:Aspartate/glutamate family transporter n=3 Tax=Ferroplasmaceae TaxID=90142 RepID=A0A1V0N3N7_9ARCH|nr:aspartate/glutamate family transporter [Ferroplasma acidiphilum]